MCVCVYECLCVLENEIMVYSPFHSHARTLEHPPQLDR